jgi:FO synthase
MSREDVDESLRRASDSECTEALFCLGDTPEKAFSAYRRQLAELGADSTVDYLVQSGRRALELGVLPHTNAGILTYDEMQRLRKVNVSLGLMLESVSERLCEKGGPHYKAPDKRPAVRLRMTREAGELKIPFTSGVLIGIGETPEERLDTLFAIRDLHARYGHIQEVIVQNFRSKPGTPMAGCSEPTAEDMIRTVALARLVLPAEVSVQAPPNLNPASISELIQAGLNDFGGISPVTPDFINPEHPWPHLAQLAQKCRDAGFYLQPRLPIYPRYRQQAEFLDPSLRDAVDAAADGLWRAERFIFSPIDADKRDQAHQLSH